jgi:uncharacterized protein (UPF0333 family)
MLHRLKLKSGQSTLEYVILIVIVIIALLTIQTYFKRGVQGRMRSAADDIGKQYETTTTNHTKTTTTNSRVTDITSAEGTVTYANRAGAGFTGERVVVDDTWLTNNTQQVYVP